MDLIPPPTQVVEPEPPDSTGSENSFGRRIAASLIDFAVLLALFVVLAVTIGEASVGRGQASFHLGWQAGLLYLALVLLYYFVLEAATGRTVGKFLVGLRVVGRDGGRPPITAIAIRTVLRPVDWLPLFYLAGFVSMLATGARRQRLGDLAAGTTVPRAAPIRHRGLAAAAVASSVVLIVAGSVVYVAKTTPSDLDTAELEHAITEGTVEGVRLDWARCPRRVKQMKGNTFQCTARLADQYVTLQVIQKDDRGSVHIDNVEAILDRARLADGLAKDLTTTDGEPIDVDCGRPRFLVKKVGATFTCWASTNRGETAKVTVTVDDKHGNVHWSLD
jgi:uncharacterized RDD family membrane protein YckC